MSRRSASRVPAHIRFPEYFSEVSACPPAPSRENSSGSCLHPLFFETLNEPGQFRRGLRKVRSATLKIGAWDHGLLPQCIRRSASPRDAVPPEIPAAIDLRCDDLARKTDLVGIAKPFLQRRACLHPHPRPEETQVLRASGSFPGRFSPLPPETTHVHVPLMLLPSPSGGILESKDSPPMTRKERNGFRDGLFPLFEGCPFREPERSWDVRLPSVACEQEF